MNFIHSLFHNRFFRDMVGTLTAVVLLVLSFPKVSWYGFAFIALIPLFNIIDDKKPVKAFGCGYLFGLIFFSVMLYWIGYVTWVGAGLLILYLALYPALFAMGYVSLQRLPLVVRLLAIPSGWVVLEFVRGHLLSGFGWVALADTQYLNTIFIQFADITGALGISFVIVFVNLCFKEALSSQRRHSVVMMLLAIGVVLLCYVYGYMRMTSVKIHDSVKVGAVQGNISLEMRWNHLFRKTIVAKHLFLSQEILAESPDIIIWPETSYPGIIWEYPDLFNKIRDAAQSWQTPLLVGVVTEMQKRFYNSAMLLDREGRMAAQYNKNHLVPFGEYIPFRAQLPFLEDIVPIDDFTPGSTIDLIPIKNHWAGVLICFEDTFAYLARKMALQGADVFFNITNDAWFRDSKEPLLHLSSSVLRAVEFKRSVVRAANTGISAFIDPVGQIQHVIQDEKGFRTFVKGSFVQSVPLSKEKTFYTKFGNVFTYACFLCILLALANTNMIKWRKGKIHE